MLSGHGARGGPVPLVVVVVMAFSEQQTVVKHSQWRAASVTTVANGGVGHGGCGSWSMARGVSAVSVVSRELERRRRGVRVRSRSSTTGGVL